MLFDNDGITLICRSGRCQIIAELKYALAHSTRFPILCGNEWFLHESPFTQYSGLQVTEYNLHRWNKLFRSRYFFSNVWRCTMWISAGYAKDVALEKSNVMWSTTLLLLNTASLNFSTLKKLGLLIWRCQIAGRASYV